MWRNKDWVSHTFLNELVLGAVLVISGKTLETPTRLDVVQQVVNTNLMRLTANHRSADAANNLARKITKVVLLNPVQSRHIFDGRVQGGVVNVQLGVLCSLIVDCLNQSTDRLKIPLR